MHFQERYGFEFQEDDIVTVNLNRVLEKLSRDKLVFKTQVMNKSRGLIK